MKHYEIKLWINFDEELNQDEILEKIESDLWELEERIIEIQVDNITCHENNKKEEQR